VFRKRMRGKKGAPGEKRVVTVEEKGGKKVPRNGSREWKKKRSKSETREHSTIGEILTSKMPQRNLNFRLLKKKKMR